MYKARLGILLVLLIGFIAIDGASVSAQGFGGAFGRRKIVLVRKLPPVGHIDGSAFTVNVTGPGIPGDVIAILKSTIESLIVSNDSQLRSVELGEHPDAIINCQISTFSEPPPVVTQETGLAFVKKGMPLQNQPMMHVTGLMAANFTAQDLHSKRSIAANTVMAKFDQEFVVPPPASTKPTLGGILAAHMPKMPTGGGGPHASDDPSKAPTPAELRDWLIKSTGIDIASLLVNTSEDVSVELAVGGGLDEADRLMDQKLWTRALETLETLPPSGQPDQDAYRIYNLGVVNEALGYEAEDVIKARKYLQEASIDYGKAIDAKPSEKNFLQPQTRIDTALAHYKTLGDRATAAQVASAAPAAPAAEALTNADVIAMVGAKLDEANILDTIKSAGVVNFDLSAHGQIDLAKAKVSNNVITAMKAKARGQ